MTLVIREFESRRVAVRKLIDRLIVKYQRCYHQPICLRPIRYDYRCWKHQDDA